MQLYECTLSRELYSLYTLCQSSVRTPHRAWNWNTYSSLRLLGLSSPFQVTTTLQWWFAVQKFLRGKLSCVSWHYVFSLKISSRSSKSTAMGYSFSFNLFILSTFACWTPNAEFHSIRSFADAVSNYSTQHAVLAGTTIVHLFCRSDWRLLTTMNFIMLRFA